MIKRLDIFLDKSAFAIMALSLFFMLFLPLFNIVARWFGQSILWIDPLVRHLVFLSAFMGGVLATGKGNHIKLDLVSRALEGLHKKRLKKMRITRLSSVIKMLVCQLLYPRYSVSA